MKRFFKGKVTKVKKTSKKNANILSKNHLSRLKYLTNIIKSPKNTGASSQLPIQPTTRPNFIKKLITVKHKGMSKGKEELNVQLANDSVKSSSKNSQNESSNPPSCIIALEEVYETKKRIFLGHFRDAETEWLDVNGRKFKHLPKSSVISSKKDENLKPPFNDLAEGWSWLNSWENDGIDSWEFSTSWNLPFISLQTPIHYIKRRKWTRLRIKKNPTPEDKKELDKFRITYTIPKQQNNWEKNLQDLKAKLREEMEANEKTFFNNDINPLLSPEASESTTTDPSSSASPASPSGTSALKPHILLLGGSGAGKSSLVNAIFGKTLAQIGEGKPVTQCYSKYSGKNSPVVIYDSKGIEYSHMQTEFLRDTKNFFLRLATLKNGEKGKKIGIDEQIHCVWYVLDLTQARFQPFEAEFCSQFLKHYPIIFVLNKADAVPKSVTLKMMQTISSFKLKNCKGIFPTVSSCKSFEEFKTCPECDSTKIRKRIREGTECTILCKDCNKTSMLSKVMGVDKVARATIEVMPTLIQETYLNSHVNEMLAKEFLVKKLIMNYIIGGKSSSQVFDTLPVPAGENESKNENDEKNENIEKIEKKIEKLGSSSSTEPITFSKGNDFVERSLLKLTEELVDLYELQFLKPKALMMVKKKFAKLTPNFLKGAVWFWRDFFTFSGMNSAQALVIVIALEVSRQLIIFKTQAVKNVVETKKMSQKSTKINQNQSEISENPIQNGKDLEDKFVNKEISDIEIQNEEESAIEDEVTLHSRMIANFSLKCIDSDMIAACISFINTNFGGNIIKFLNSISIDENKIDFKLKEEEEEEDEDFVMIPYQKADQLKQEEEKPKADQSKQEEEKPKIPEIPENEKKDN